MDNNIGQKVRQRRRIMGMTLRELAGDKVTAAQISAIEKGKCKPSQTLLEYIAERLDLEVEYFTLSDDEKIKKEFNDKTKDIKKFLEEKKYNKVIDILDSFGEKLSYLSEEQKGFYYLVHGDILFSTENYTSSFDNYIKSITYYLKTHNNDIVADVYIKTGNCLFNTEKYELALGYYLNAKLYSKNSNDNTLKARALFDIALCNQVLKRYNNCKEYIELLDNLVKSSKSGELEKFIPGINMIKGSVEIDLLENHKSIKSFEDAFEKYREKGDLLGMGKAKNNLAISCWNNEDYDGAERYFKEAIEYTKQINDRCIVDNYLNLSELYAKTKRNDMAMETIGIAEEAMMSQNDSDGIIKVFMAKFELLVETGDFERAEVFAFFALDYIQKKGDSLLEAKLYLKLSDMYKRLGNDTSSVEYAVKAKVLLV